MVQKNWVVLAIARKVGNTSRETTIYVLLVLVSDPNFFSVQIVRAILFHTNRHTFELLVTLQNRRNVLRFSLGRTGAQSECKGHVTCAKKKSLFSRTCFGAWSDYHLLSRTCPQHGRAKNIDYVFIANFYCVLIAWIGFAQLNSINWNVLD